MTAIDTAALERSSSQPISLLDAMSVREDGSSEAVSGFDAFSRVYVEIAVGELRRGSRDAQVAFQVEKSENGSEWSNAETGPTANDWTCAVGCAP